MKRDDLSHLLTLDPPVPVSGDTLVYILACSDGAVYVASAGDVAKRLGEHGEGSWKEMKGKFKQHFGKFPQGKADELWGRLQKKGTLLFSPQLFSILESNGNTSKTVWEKLSDLGESRNASGKPEENRRRNRSNDRGKAEKTVLSNCH